MGDQTARRSGDIGGLDKFDPKGEPSAISQRWKRWKRAFELYVTGKERITDDGQKAALLLHTAGMDVQEIFFSLSAENKSYAETMEILDSYFVPKSNIPFERYLFRQICQENETVDQFVCRLRQRAASCEFGTATDDYIRDQVIDKCQSTQLRRKYLEKDNVKLEDCLKIARAYEAVDHQVKTMETRSSCTDDKSSNVGGTKGPVLNKSGDDVNAVRKGRKETPNQSSHMGNRNKECFACGGLGHFARDKKCPARNSDCRCCGEIGHFAIKCPQKRKQENPQRQGYGQSRGRGGQHRGGRGRGAPRGGYSNTHQVTGNNQAGAGNEQYYDYAYNEEHAFYVNNERKKDTGTVTLNVGGVDSADILIDSGATSNLMGQPTWEWLKRHGIKCESKRSAKVLFAYGSQEPLETLGTFKANVKSGDSRKQCTAEFIVVKGHGRTLLGRETAEELKLLRVGPVRVNTIVSEHTEIDIRKDFKDLFEGVGLLKDYDLSLNINEDVKPVAQQVRRIPFGLRDKVDEKLDELLDLGIIEEVPEGPTAWVSPLVVVPKKDGDVRVCVDMRRANQAIVRERQPIPTVEEILHDLNGSTVFTKLDLKWGFHQVSLKEESRHITTFATHRGLFRYRRLMFGISSAPEKYQKIIQDVFRTCRGVENIADDIIVHGKGVQEHDERLYAALNRLREVGMTLNGQKCEFRLSRLTFFGHEMTDRGVNPSEEKVAAIQDAEAPTTASEARSFMGLVQYSAKFIPNLASISRPIQDLTRKGTQFVWGDTQEAAFQELKRLITDPDTLAYFRIDCQTRIVADASPVGLGAVLTQCQDNEWRVISYASRSLTEVERRYSQTEKEALALVWACERFNIYIFGRQFELETDHKPLECIYTPTSKPSARIERWILRLQAYDFKVIYRPGKTNIADVLSRLNSKVKRDHGENYDFVRAVVENSVPVALTPREIERASAEDGELRHIKSCVRSGNWEQCKFPGYTHVKDELCVYGELLLRGTRIVIPHSLRDRVVKLAHEGHQGIVKTKNRLRSKVWWPKMDRQAENVCKVCYGCQLVSQYSPPEPMARVVPPSGPWQDCAADILGPLPTGESILVIVDYYSRYYEVAILRSTTATCVIRAIHHTFARLGIPFSLRTDNGPQFISGEFQGFLEEYGVEWRRTPPLWPQANGEVERQNRTLMKTLRVAKVEKKNWRWELNNYLLAYRSTPQATTGATPFFLMFGREMKSKLPEIRREQRITDEAIRDHDWESKLRGKTYADDRRKAAKDTLDVGDKVLLRARKTDKMSTNFEDKMYKVVEREGGEVTVRDDDGREVRRNTTHFRRLNEEESMGPELIEKQNDSHDLESNDKVVSSPVPTHSPRPSRTHKVPSRFDDFIMK